MTTPTLPPTTRQVLLAARPVGAPKESDFRIADAPLREVGDGDVLVKNIYLSLDPYMRGRMNEGKSYAARTEIDQVMIGATVGEIIASKNPKFAVGDTVMAYLGWQTYAVLKGEGLMKVDGKRVPLSAYLGAVGMPGVTAWYGLNDIGKPKPGETVVVAAASGAVGSVAGQLAKIHGCRAIGIAGGKEKCEWVVKELGFDACLDHRDPALKERFREATPKGVDIYFENVGGAILEMVLGRLNAFARIPLCGLVSQYNATEAYPLKNFGALLTNRATLQGFIVSEHMDRWPAALTELGKHVAEGRIKYRETIAEGLDDAPKAFIGMLEGKNFGKQLVKVGLARVVRALGVTLLVMCVSCTDREKSGALPAADALAPPASASGSVSPFAPLPSALASSLLPAPAPPPAPIVSTPPSEWTWKTYRGDKFSILFPGEPKLRVLPPEDDRVGYTEAHLDMPGGQVSFVAGYTEHTKEDVSKPDAFLDARANPQRRGTTEVLAKRSISLPGGQPGRVVILRRDISGTPLRVYSRLYLVGLRLYSLIVSTLDLGGVSEDVVKRFMDSFKLL